MHRTSICSSLGLSLLFGLASPAIAQLSQGPGGNNPPDPSLVLLIWDSTNKVAFTRDTGLTGTSLYKSLSDAGTQSFWTLDPATDPNFAQFIKASPDLSQDSWMVIGAGLNLNGTASKYPGGIVEYMTMANTSLVNGQPIKNPLWDTFTAVANSALNNSANTVGTNLYNNLNAGGASGVNTNPYNTYSTASRGNGSSFESLTSNAYVFDGSYGLTLAGSPGEALFDGTVDIGNPLGTTGSSSWFYYLTTSPSSAGANKPYKASSPMSVSAFANSAKLAYWGLATTTNATHQPELVLSFTLPPAVTPTTTAAGAARRNGTDYIASYGSTRLINLPATDVVLASAGTVSAVPDPSSWLLMAGGLVGLAAAARRQQRRRA